MFNRYDAQQILQRLNPLEFYQKELHPWVLSTGGWCIGMHCPFHQSREKCFYIDTLTGGFHCLQCGVQGEHVIAFTQQKYQLPFSQAVSKIIKEWNFYE